MGHVHGGYHGDGAMYTVAAMETEPCTGQVSECILQLKSLNHRGFPNITASYHQPGIPGWHAYSSCPTYLRTFLPSPQKQA